MKLLLVEMGTGYDLHGQDITAASCRACRDAIARNSIPAFTTGEVTSQNDMKLKVKLGVPSAAKHGVDMESVKSVFPYGKVEEVEVVEGGMTVPTGDPSEDICYVANAAVYVGC